VSDDKLPPEPWRADPFYPAMILDADGCLIASALPPGVAALLLAAPTTARRLERIEQAARELLLAYDVGYPATEIFKLFEALRAALEEKR
jgi:hypothetical protein